MLRFLLLVVIQLLGCLQYASVEAAGGLVPLAWATESMSCYGLVIEPEDANLVYVACTSSIRKFDLLATSYSDFGTFTKATGLAYVSNKGVYQQSNGAPSVTPLKGLIVGDQGTYTLKFYNLDTLATTVVAGESGTPGAPDGWGSAARFKQFWGIGYGANPNGSPTDRTFVFYIPEAWNGYCLKQAIAYEDVSTTIVLDVKTVAGVCGGTATNSDGLVYNVERMSALESACATKDGNTVFITDYGNSKLRKIYPMDATATATRSISTLYTFTSIYDIDIHPLHMEEGKELLVFLSWSTGNPLEQWNASATPEASTYATLPTQGRGIQFHPNGSLIVSTTSKLYIYCCTPSYPEELLNPFSPVIPHTLTQPVTRSVSPTLSPTKSASLSLAATHSASVFPSVSSTLPSPSSTLLPSDTASMSQTKPLSTSISMFPTPTNTLTLSLAPSLSVTMGGSHSITQTLSIGLSSSVTIGRTITQSYSSTITISQSFPSTLTSTLGGTPSDRGPRTITVSGATSTETSSESHTKTATVTETLTLFMDATPSMAHTDSLSVTESLIVTETNTGSTTFSQTYSTSFSQGITPSLTAAFPLFYVATSTTSVSSDAKPVLKKNAAPVVVSAEAIAKHQGVAFIVKVGNDAFTCKPSCSVHFLNAAVNATVPLPLIISCNSTFLVVQFPAKQTKMDFHGGTEFLGPLSIQGCTHRQPLPSESYINVKVVNDIYEAPDVVSKETEEAVQEATASVTAVASLAAAGPAVAAQGSRLAFALSLAKCEANLEDELDLMTSPTGIIIGEGPLAPYFGAIVINTILITGALILHFLLCCLLTLVPGRTLLSSLGTLRFPGMHLFPVLFFSQPTLASCVTILQNGTSTSRSVIAAAILVYWLIIPVWWVLAFRRNKDGSGFNVAREIQEGESKKLTWDILYNGRGKWVDKQSHGSTRKFYVKRYGQFFKDYRDTCHWFVFVELAFSYSSGIIQGILPQNISICQALAVIASTFYGLYFLAIAWYHPFDAFGNTFVVTPAAFFQFIGVMLNASYISSKSVLALKAGSTLPMITTFLLLGKSVLDIFKDLHHFLTKKWEERKERKKKNGERKRKSLEDDSSSSSNDDERESFFEKEKSKKRFPRHHKHRQGQLEIPLLQTGGSVYHGDYQAHEELGGETLHARRNQNHHSEEEEEEMIQLSPMMNDDPYTPRTARRFHMETGEGPRHPALDDDLLFGGNDNDNGQDSSNVPPYSVDHPVLTIEDFIHQQGGGNDLTAPPVAATSSQSHHAVFLDDDDL